MDVNDALPQSTVRSLSKLSEMKGISRSYLGSAKLIATDLVLMKTWKNVEALPLDLKDNGMWIVLQGTLDVLEWALVFPTNRALSPSGLNDVFEAACRSFQEGSDDVGGDEEGARRPRVSAVLFAIIDSDSTLTYYRAWNGAAPISVACPPPSVVFSE